MQAKRHDWFEAGSNGVWEQRSGSARARSQESRQRIVKCSMTPSSTECTPPSSGRVPTSANARPQFDGRRWSAVRASRSTLVHVPRWSARRHAFREFARELPLCRGPGSNRRHMVLQTIALPTELPRRDPDSIRYSASGSNGLTRHGLRTMCGVAQWSPRTKHARPKTIALLAGIERSKPSSA